MDSARRIASARLTNTPLAALRAPPGDEAAAYILQDAVRDIVAADPRFGAPVGFKIGCTSPVMQDYLAIDHPCAGAMYAGGMLASGATIAPEAYQRPGIEMEIAVELSRAFESAPFTRDSAAAAIGAVFAAIELVDDRYEDWRALSAPTLIADDFFHAGLVRGPRVENWRGLDLASLAGVARINGVEIGRGHGADILGHPLDVLVWLGQHRAARGLPLPAGTIISLGSMIRTHWLVPGDVVEIAIENLGAAALRYAQIRPD